MTTKPFIHDDFLLQNDTARLLYHDYAAGMPIMDYHCHLSPAEVAADTRWDNIAQVWLYGDHYKWRTMRSNGIEERYCTGEATDREKFQKFAETMPYLYRNPMYHWSHLELSRYFGIDDLLLSGETAQEIWERTTVRLEEPWMSARGLMEHSRVKLVCTTDDPTDSLAHHQTLAADASFKVKVLPTWRPDKALAIYRANPADANNAERPFWKHLDEAEQAGFLSEAFLIQLFDDSTIVLFAEHADDHREQLLNYIQTQVAPFQPRP